ncbi:MAG: hypothetical protein EHM58_03245 [Ignavibacteriae bacterium]|nr:MAG: hypothetical protein EHM58_03245 [Ignavibacteriota bacterium]
METVKTANQVTIKRNGREANLSSKQLKVIYKETQLFNDDKQKIHEEFDKLLSLRCEEKSDYNFDALFDFWSEEGYSVNDVLEMIHLAKSLPKKGHTRLAAGDLVAAWKKNREKAMGISWQEFNKAFKVMCELNFELMNRASLELTGVGLLNHEDKMKTFDFLKKQMDAIEIERSKTEYQNKMNNDRAVVNWRERGELSLKAEKILNDVKLELIDWFIKTYERRKTINHPSPAGHIYELKEKLEKAA